MERSPNHWDGLVTGIALVTLAGDEGYSVVEDAALAWRDGTLAFVGRAADLPADALADARYEWDGGLVPYRRL